MSEDKERWGEGRRLSPIFSINPDGSVQMSRADLDMMLNKVEQQQKEIENLQTDVLVADPGRWTKKQCELITVAIGAKADGFVAVLDHVQNLRTEVQQFRSHLYHANDSLQETASALAATSKEQVRLVRERDTAVQELTQCKRAFEQSRAQEEIARAKEATMRSAYLPVLAQAKIAADFQEALEKIAVLCNGQSLHALDVIPLTELPALLARLLARLPHEVVADHINAYVAARYDAQRTIPDVTG